MTLDVPMQPSDRMLSIREVLHEHLRTLMEDFQDDHDPSSSMLQIAAMVNVASVEMLRAWGGEGFYRYVASVADCMSSPTPREMARHQRSMLRAMERMNRYHADLCAKLDLAAAQPEGSA